MQKWEYHTTFVWANAQEQQARDFLNQRWPTWKAPKFAPQAMIPALNSYGEAGWELIHMEPVYIGTNEDIAHGGDTRLYSNVYFCVFKRAKPDLP